MELDPDFTQYVSYLNLTSIAASEDVIYFIDHNYRIRGFNNAWKNFAISGNGSAVLTEYRFGRSIFDGFVGGTIQFYKQAYHHVLTHNERFDQNYDCSSPSEFRRFHLSVYPLHKRRGLWISNHLIEHKPIPFPAHDKSNQYFDKSHYIIQCAHCRRIKNRNFNEKWDWVPAYVEAPYEKTSHTFCPNCLDFYYPDVDSDDGR